MIIGSFRWNINWGVIYDLVNQPFKMYRQGQKKNNLQENKKVVLDGRKGMVVDVVVLESSQNAQAYVIIAELCY